MLTALLAARRSDPLLGSGYWRKVDRMAFFPRLVAEHGVKPATAQLPRTQLWPSDPV